MNKIIEFVKENKVSFLVVIIVASIVYAGLSVLNNSWTWWGQVLIPLLGIITYIILKLI